MAFSFETEQLSETRICLVSYICTSMIICLLRLSAQQGICIDVRVVWQQRVKERSVRQPEAEREKKRIKKGKLLVTHFVHLCIMLKVFSFSQSAEHRFQDLPHTKSQYFLHNISNAANETFSHFLFRFA